MTGAFYSTYPSLFLFGITAELRLELPFLAPRQMELANQSFHVLAAFMVLTKSA